MWCENRHNSKKPLLPLGAVVALLRIAFSAPFPIVIRKALIAGFGFGWHERCRKTTGAALLEVDLAYPAGRNCHLACFA